MNSKSTQMIIGSVLIAGSLIASALIVASNSPGSSTILVGSTGGVARAEVREFDIVMQNNRYNPSEITANVGDRVIINFTNKDNVNHAVEIPQFNVTVPGGHVPAGGTARMEFVADKKMSADAAVCGGPVPTDKTDDHGEELIVNIV